MTKPTVLEEQYMNMAELKGELAKIKKRDETLNFRAEKTAEYLDIFCKIKPKEAKEILTKLTELDLPRLKENHLNKLVDLMPSTPADVKVVLQEFTVTISNDNAKKVVDVLSEYQKKK